MVYRKKKKSVLQRERLGLKTDRARRRVRGVRKKKVLGRYMDGLMNRHVLNEEEYLKKKDGLKKKEFFERWFGVSKRCQKMMTRKMVKIEKQVS
jgi:hypothetical protein